MGQAGSRRPHALRIPNPGRRPSWPELGHRPEEATKLPHRVRQLRSQKDRPLRPPQNPKPDERRRNNPQSPEDYLRHKKRERILTIARRVRIIRRLHLAIHRRHADGERPALDERSPSPHPRIRRHEQRLKAARILLRRHYHLLRLHASRGHGERPPDRLLPLRTTRRLI